MGTNDNDDMGTLEGSATIHHRGEYGDPFVPDVRGTMNPNHQLLLSVEEAADVLRIGRTRTYELVMTRKIQSVKVGRRRLVVRSSLYDFVQTLLLEQECG
jgi:excisionase family DNA binding protein